MGLFGGLKNFITGGGAEVSLTIGDPVRGKSMPVSVAVKIGDKGMDVRKVYVRLRAREVIDIPDAQVASSTDSKSLKRGLQRTSETFDQTVTIAPTQTLEAGESYEFEGEVTIPGDVAPSFTGRYAKHVWQITAGLDKAGNDPDSGWTDLHIR